METHKAASTRRQRDLDPLDPWSTPIFPLREGYIPEWLTHRYSWQGSEERNQNEY